MSGRRCSCSVIIPTADRGALLARCLGSVVEQSVKAAAIIVVDNGVEDAHIPDEYKELVTLIRTAPRIGPGKARNIGAWAAKTDYIAFLDDDDYWEKDYIGKSYDKCVDANVIVGQLKRVSADGILRPYKLMPSSAVSQRSVYFKNPGFGGQNIMLRRELFKNLGGFDEKMPASVDRDLAARILQAGECIFVEPEAIAVLCDHDGERVRASQVKGNFLFLKKHWRKMTLFELVRASLTLARRYVRNKLANRKII